MRIASDRSTTNFYSSIWFYGKISYNYWNKDVVCMWKWILEGAINGLV